jgi:hypothetical protein
MSYVPAAIGRIAHRSCAIKQAMAIARVVVVVIVVVIVPAGKIMTLTLRGDEKREANINSPGQSSKKQEPSAPADEMRRLGRKARKTGLARAKTT